MNKKILTWLDENILLVLSSFLIAFIPLFPKLPLFDLIPGYIVRVRLEDFFVLITMIIWFIQVLRKKVEWKTPLTFVILLYAIVGILSTVSAVLITKTVPAEVLHVGKTLLHYFRYLEYFSLLFVAYSSIKSVKHLKIMLGIIAVVLVALTVYGFGQRYWYWPVYSTMNREFSKGQRLYLTEHARVQSTFGGHYDLAAYLVIMTPILLCAFYLLHNKWAKWSLFAVFLASYWLLVETASRTSYISFFLSTGIAILLSALYINKTWSSRIWWATKQYFFIGVISFLLLTIFGDSMYERLLQVLRGYPKAFAAYSQVETFVKDFRVDSINALFTEEQQETIATTFETKPPENGVSIDEVLVSSDTQPSAEVPSDVYVNVPTYETIATVSAEGTVTEVVVEKERTYSEAAQTYGLSFAIRLDTLWPRALQGFYRNPLLGSGYATLTKESVSHFTEAESTDNNFLRTLGETGILGFITFYGTVLLSGYIAFQLYLKSKLDAIPGAFVIAYLGATAGLLLNALFIDVFAASKVAFTYWTFTGIILAIQTLYNREYFSFDFLHNRFPNGFNFRSVPQQTATATRRTKKKKS